MKPFLVAVLVSQVAAAQAGPVTIPDPGFVVATPEAPLADVAAPDAGTGWAAPLYQDCPTAPPALRSEGGWFYPDLRKRRVDCLMETCRTHDELTSARLLTDPTVLLPWWFFPTLGALLGLGVGLAVGYAIGRAVPR